MIGTAGKVRGEMADAKSKGVYSGLRTAKTADLKPNCREQTKSERRCWAEARLRPMRNPVLRLRCLSRLCRVLKLSLRRYLPRRGCKLRTSDGLLVAHSRTLRRRVTCLGRSDLIAAPRCQFCALGCRNISSAPAPIGRKERGGGACLRAICCFSRDPHISIQSVRTICMFTVTIPLCSICPSPHNAREKLGR